MLTKNGNLILGTIAIITTLYLSIEFMIKSLDEKEPKKSFKYLILSTCNMLALIFATNVI
ncbi:hypothetical protein ACRTAL_001081 [Clostridium perfringens]|uniref:Uncharacterized protein n=2 Tax=Clostridium perfringens TaxID=1502 RepID=A0AAP2AZB3_CLOPF|nr:hypothetical protein [Clostridium perfringens]YP_008058957.1 hypothetical protein phiCP51_0034 [Clostridium phage vB_CpeS-CP51]DAL54587.1 MAG TPA_asm: hypothetical protein [Caudoviricetes sp.]AGH27925.1 hypothetical protein phiCP51_0034 [Clostridium phage vB_CpeS-CP51]EDT14088.1 conserved domain protein [Clostridium perfringens E str. JGS1987]EGT3618366.1 hypothetical protein [Clostridium perfringens]EGT4140221.1 hypothetical protein [Clostridium perfringens]